MEEIRGSNVNGTKLTLEIRSRSGFQPLSSGPAVAGPLLLSLKLVPFTFDLFSLGQRFINRYLPGCRLIPVDIQPQTVFNLS